MSYITGDTIRMLRERKNYTQKQLAEKLAVSDKTVSKWETGKGLPDISMVEPLARELQVSVAELFSGEPVTNSNKIANLLRGRFYVCPLCGNVIQALGEGAYSCCGITLPPLEAEESNDAHLIRFEKMDGEYYVSLEHPMTKDHYISFLACVNAGYGQMIKLYPEQGAEGRFRISGRGVLYAYCNRHGLFKVRI
ncbi:helix-turn-helix domain-containing protein [Anaerovorax odorimutans]|uniref:Helix-turn-helix domain-containing protein n=1 Tax=Anaerovorax odorimutans TaxID=109327 RepID=A0ABT1RP30_9FIRM|nr:helix-turn-helix domain-containing protein [Anaerovorax odorimutans]MCQ4636952.1 helix-turn-helix domain-containing protein [Anaerovorax odorimutans]